MLDGENGFGGDREGTLEEEVVDADDGAREGVLDGGEESVGKTVANGAEGGVERGARNGGDAFAEKLDGGFFAEGAGFTLKGNAHFMDDSIAGRGHGGRCPTYGWADRLAAENRARWAVKSQRRAFGRWSPGESGRGILP